MRQQPRSGDRAVQRLVLDSLRYWVTAFGVDGFRFDLAATLGRGRDDGFDPAHPLLAAIGRRPGAAGVKLIAEPWDVGPAATRSAVPGRRGPSGTASTATTSATSGAAAGIRRRPGARLAGRPTSSPAAAGPAASVNFVTAHDGFTLADLVAYEHKHNEANGEGNRDGDDHNRSWNHGVEGPTDDPTMLDDLRAAAGRASCSPRCCSSRACRCCSRGDELGRTQRGNNNAYCHDNAEHVGRLGRRLAGRSGAAADRAAGGPARAAADDVPRRRPRRRLAGRRALAVLDGAELGGTPGSRRRCGRLGARYDGRAADEPGAGLLVSCTTTTPRPAG